MRYRFIYWSLYSQGHFYFYHLTAVKPGGTGNLNATPEPLSRLTTRSGSPVPVFFKAQSVIEPGSADFEWRDVFYIRLDERRESYVDKERKLSNGSNLTRLMLPLHIPLRRVTKEEKKRWAAEAEGMLQ
jgi:hypothetical protein